MARDADDARQFAQETIAIINGAAQTYLTNFEPVRVGGSTFIQRDGGSRQIAQSITGKARIRLAIPAADIKDSPPIDAWMRLAYKDPQVEKALDLWGSLDHTWRNMYLVLEVMEDSVGGAKALLTEAWLPDKNGIEQFKRMANNFRALGPEARHATEQYQPPTTPMTLRDTQTLMRRTLQAWLQQR